MKTQIAIKCEMSNAEAPVLGHFWRRSLRWAQFPRVIRFISLRGASARIMNHPSL
jgi:hypothetical protein